MTAIVTYKKQAQLDIAQISTQLDAVSLDMLPKNSQMDRFDKKFIFKADLIPALLNAAAGQYNILEVDQNRILQYCSDYFDTPEYSMYTHHHNGKKNRYKIRIREYLNSGDKFLEIKHKNNKSFTKKIRIPYSGQIPFNKKATGFIQTKTGINADSLALALTTSYQRITLINKLHPERITLDFNLKINTPDQHKPIDMLAIAEIKSSDRHLRSPFYQYLKLHGIKQVRFSKYCIGTAMLNPNVKSNLFKEMIQKINKFAYEPSVCHHQSSI